MIRNQEEAPAGPAGAFLQNGSGREGCAAVLGEAAPGDGTWPEKALGACAGAREGDWEEI